MNTFLKIGLFVLALFVGIFIFRECSSDDTPGETIKVDGKKYELVKHKIDTFIVEKPVVKYVKGNDIYHETIIEKEKRVEVPVYTKGDTIKIVEEYNKKILYKDKLVLKDDLGTVEITDTIYQNKILGRKWNAVVKERTVVDTKIVKELPKNQVYVGAQAFVGGSTAMVGPQISLKTKKDNLYGTSVLIDGNGNRYFGVSVGWKIKLKK